MEGLINVSEFMDHLKANDLVIVSRKDLLLHTVTKRELLRKDLLKRKWLTLREIIEAELLPLKTKQGIRDWITSGKIKAAEVMKNSQGSLLISFSAIERLGYNFK